MGAKSVGPLKAHPNFKPPDPIMHSNRDVEAIVKLTLEYAARLASPPKVEGESEERPCDEVAAEIRGSVGDVLSAIDGWPL